MNSLPYKWIVFLTYLLLYYYGKSQEVFEKNYYLDNCEPYNISPGILNTIDHGFYVLSFSGDTNASNNFFINISRLNKNGDVLWNKNSDRFTINADEGFAGIVQYPDSSLVFISPHEYAGEWAWGHTAFIHVDKKGNGLWMRNYFCPPDRGDIYISSLERTYDNGLIAKGDFFAYPSGLDFVFLLKTDSVGNIEWCKQYYPDSTYSFSADSPITRVALSPDSGFLVTFDYSDSIHYNDYACLMKTDSKGNFQWAMRYDTGAPQFTKPQIRNGSIYLAYGFNLFSNIEILKTNMNGVPLWNFIYDGPDLCWFYDGITDNKGNTYLSGFTCDTLGFIFKIDSTGYVRWAYKYGKPDSSLIANMLLTSDGGVLGYCDGPVFFRNSPAYSFIDLIKVDSLGHNGCEMPFQINIHYVPIKYQNTGIKVYDVAMTQKDTILNFHDAPIDTTTLCAVKTMGVKEVKTETENVKVYPNPTSGKAEIVVSGKSSAVSEIQIEVYNVFGEVVFSQSSIENPAFTIDLSGQPNGVYFYRVTRMDEIASRSLAMTVGTGKIVVEK